MRDELKKIERTAATTRSKRDQSLSHDIGKLWPKQDPLQEHNNRAIFEKIALACTLDVAIEIAGVSLTNGKGGLVNNPKLRKIYRSPFRDDQKPSFGFFKHRSGCLSFKDYGTNQKGNLIQFVRLGLGCSYPDAARLIDEKMNLGLWTEPKPKNVEDGIKNYKDLRVTLEPDDEAFDLILKQLGLVGDSSWLREEKMLVVGQYFGRGSRGQKFCHDVWGMIEPERLIGRIRGLYKPFSRATKSLGIRGWKNGFCGLSELSEGSVFLCEGEKDFLALKATGIWDSGIFATTASIGQSLDVLYALEDRHVTICPQADMQGIKAAQKWVNELTDFGVDNLDILIPKIKGEDWANLMSGNRYGELRNFISGFNKHSVEELLAIDPNDFPEAKKEEIPRVSPSWDRAFTQRLKDACWENNLPYVLRSTTPFLEALGLEKSNSNRKKISRHLVYCVTKSEFLD